MIDSRDVVVRVHILHIPTSGQEDLPYISLNIARHTHCISVCLAVSLGTEVPPSRPSHTSIPNG